MSDQNRSETSEAKIIAHRGDSKYFPENRRPAFESARNKGAHILETDLHRTSDHVIVLNHDDTVDNGFGPTAIRGMCSKDFLKIDGALTLEIFLHEFSEFPCNVDLKEKDKVLIDMAVRVLRTNKALDRIVVASFHHSNLKYFRKLCPDCETSMSPVEVFFFYLACKFGFRKNKPAKIKYIQTSETFKILTIITPKFIEYAHGRGAFVQPWTINEKEDMIRLIDWGVDGLFTDDPGLLAQVLEEKKNELNR